MAIVNTNDIDSLVSSDRVFEKILSQYGPPPNWQRAEGFISLCRIILEQQISLKAAEAHFLRLKGYLSEFTPENVLQLSDEEMRSCQISRQKATYLRALADSTLNGGIDFNGLSKLTPSNARSRLVSIKGIGNWTADVYLMFCLQAKDLFPIGDIALVNAARTLTGVHTREEILVRSEQWKPFRTLASYFLWHFYLSERDRKNPMETSHE